MACPICHTDATRGDGHRCLAVPGPGATATTTAPMTGTALRLAMPAIAGWQKLAQTALALACLYLAVCLFRIGFTVYETGRLISLLDNPQPDGYAQIQTLSHQEKALSPLLLAVMIGALIACFLFQRDARIAVEAAGLDARDVARHWSVAVWRVALVVNPVLAIFFASSLPSDDTSTDIPTIEAQIRHIAAVQELGLGFRCVVALALIGAMIGLRARTRKTLAAAQA